VTTDQQAASEAAIDAQAAYAGLVALAEAVTGKRGSEALATLVRQRALSDDEAARIMRRSGRQATAPRQEMTLAEYRQRFGYRTPPLDSGSVGPKLNAGGRSVQLTQSLEADPTHNPRFVELWSRGHFAEANALLAELTAEREANRPPTSKELAAAELARYHATAGQRSQLSPPAAAMRERHPGAYQPVKR
jgi:hypothetical protein